MQDADRASIRRQAELEDLFCRLACFRGSKAELLLLVKRMNRIVRPRRGRKASRERKAAAPRDAGTTAVFL